jgi:hypothetical protein
MPVILSVAKDLSICLCTHEKLTTDFKDDTD